MNYAQEFYKTVQEERGCLSSLYEDMVKDWVDVHLKKEFLKTHERFVRIPTRHLPIPVAEFKEVMVGLGFDVSTSSMDTWRVDEWVTTIKIPQ